MVTMRLPNSTPMVKSCTRWNRLSVNCNNRQDLPTPAKEERKQKKKHVVIEWFRGTHQKRRPCKRKDEDYITVYLCRRLLCIWAGTRNSSLSQTRATPRKRSDAKRPPSALERKGTTILCVCWVSHDTLKTQDEERKKSDEIFVCKRDNNKRWWWYKMTFHLHRATPATKTSLTKAMMMMLCYFCRA